MASLAGRVHGVVVQIRANTLLLSASVQIYNVQVFMFHNTCIPKLFIVRDLSVFDLHCILRKSSPFKVKHASNVSTATGNLTYTALLTKPGSYSNSASANAVLKKIKENSSK